MKVSVLLTITIIFLIGLRETNASYGIDISFPIEKYYCLQNNGIELLIPIAYQGYGALDPDALNNIKNAQKLGLRTDILHIPCTGIQASKQANLVTAALGKTFDRVWIQVQTNPSSGCGWDSSDYKANCDFLGSLVKAYSDQGYKVGIFSSLNDWTKQMGGAGGCPNFTNLPVWYSNPDNLPSFSDWNVNAFGGWKNPTLKQYMLNALLCGVVLNLDYYSQ